MSFISHSQSGEDMHLRYLLKSSGVDPTTGGFYVDVGAHHPRRFSNTKFFYDLGWRGINIDPDESLMEIFSSERPDDICLPIGISNKNETKNFYFYNEPAFNSVYDRTEELQNSNDRLERILELEFFTLSQILQQHLSGTLPSPNFLNVDVEGHEIEVLQGNDWDRYQFDYVLVEEKLGNSASNINSEIGKYLKERGLLLVASTSLTSIYKSR